MDYFINGISSSPSRYEEWIEVATKKDKQKSPRRQTGFSNQGSIQGSTTFTRSDDELALHLRNFTTPAALANRVCPCPSDVFAGMEFQYHADGQWMLARNDGLTAVHFKRQGVWILNRDRCAWNACFFVVAMGYLFSLNGLGRDACNH